MPWRLTAFRALGIGRLLYGQRYVEAKELERQIDEYLEYITQPAARHRMGGRSSVQRLCMHHCSTDNATLGIHRDMDSISESQLNLVSAGMRTKAASGFVIGSAKLGYTAEHSREGVRAVLDQTVAPLLANAFVMAGNDASLREIISQLQTRDVRGKRGELVALATVQRFLTNPYYAGFLQNEAGQWVAGAQKAIVSPELFAVVQRKLLARRCSQTKRK